MGIRYESPIGIPVLLYGLTYKNIMFILSACSVPEVASSRPLIFFSSFKLSVSLNRDSVFFIGNGGSAATASHMSNDLSLGSHTCEDDLPFRSLALTDNAAVTTAIANDHGYDNLFVHQLRVHYRTGDKLVAISASGNSPNVIAAAEWVKKRGGIVIGLVGFDGGKLKNICDIAIHARTSKGEYGPVEDIHIILDHLIYTWLWYRKRKEKSDVKIFAGEKK